MNIELKFNQAEATSEDCLVVASFQRITPAKGKSKEKKEMVSPSWTKEMKDAFSAVKASANFLGDKGQFFKFPIKDGRDVIAVGLGDKKDLNLEDLRRTFSNLYKNIEKTYTSASVLIDGFVVKNNLDSSIEAIVEGTGLTNYNFTKYLSKNDNTKLKKLYLDSNEKKTKFKKAKAALDRAKTVVDAINTARDFINEAPNVLNSETYAKRIKEDVKGIKGVRVKVIGREEMKKQKMGLFLSVNAGSAYEPQLVHLSYAPMKSTKKTKHIALVGKGLTFDTGGYSLKPGASMINMKFDMAGSATVYAAFKAMASLGVDVQLTCIMGMTDNAVSSYATMPDSIVRGRSGKTVEILNTDAEGRLVLADCLDYACDQKPDVIIDAATLTGACLMAVGSEMCAVMGNNQSLVDALLNAAKEADEYMWQLPIIEEFRKDMKSPVADLKNIGGKPYGGTMKGAAFLEEFIKNDIAWAHLDIAGIAEGQGHLPYCPGKGASGLVVRTLCRYIEGAGGL